MAAAVGRAAASVRRRGNRVTRGLANGLGRRAVVVSTQPTGRRKTTTSGPRILYVITVPGGAYYTAHDRAAAWRRASQVSEASGVPVVVEEYECRRLSVPPEARGPR